MIMTNTDATHLPGEVFKDPNFILEVDPTKQFNAGLGNADPVGPSFPPFPPSFPPLAPRLVRANPPAGQPGAHCLRRHGDPTTRALPGAPPRARPLSGRAPRAGPRRRAPPA